MSFADTEFLPFLALVLLAWPFVPVRGRVPALLAASYFFYLAHVPAYGLLLAASTLVDYLVALVLAREQRAGRRKVLLVVSLALNLGALAVFKYAGFALDNLNALLGAAGRDPVPFEGLALPLGISFYTFQTLSYTFDVYARRIEPCRRIDEYALYVAFFPQLVAGPIERAGHLLPQLRSLSTLTAGNLSMGGRLILWGLLKKWVVADRMLVHVRPTFYRPEEGDPLTLVVAAMAMAAILYLDFSAYTDIARGSARLFGVELVKNFDRTFLSTSLHEWARRWHMSLIAWMYDYVWAPLSGRTPSHVGLWRANLVVMGLFGLWHGASWTFVLWGVSYGVVISVQQSLRLRRARRGLRGPILAVGPVGRAAIGALSWFATVVFGAQLMMLFFSPDLAFSARYFAAELTPGLPAAGRATAWVLMTAGVLALLLLVHSLSAWVDLERIWRRIGWAGRSAAFAAGGWIAVQYRAPVVEPFVYFQF